MKTSMKTRNLIILLALILQGINADIMAHGRVFTLEGLDCTVYLPDPNLATGRAVVICPGGAYAMHATAHEGSNWAPFFNEKGIAVAVLNYTLPKGDRNLPLADAAKTFRILRDSAENWKINPEDIGIMGSSAGGHFAATVATGGAGDASPAFQILFYPVISMDPAITHKMTHDLFLGANPSTELEKEFSNENRVSESTPRAILFFSSDDKVVPPENGLRYFQALNEKGIPVAMHFYPTGGHGWGYNKSFPYHNDVLTSLSTWLSNF